MFSLIPSQHRTQRPAEASNSDIPSLILSLSDTERIAVTMVLSVELLMTFSHLFPIWTSCYDAESESQLSLDLSFPKLQSPPLGVAALQWEYYHVCKQPSHTSDTACLANLRMDKNVILISQLRSLFSDTSLLTFYFLHPILFLGQLLTSKTLGDFVIC